MSVCWYGGHGILRFVSVESQVDLDLGRVGVGGAVEYRQTD